MLTPVPLKILSGKASFHFFFNSPSWQNSKNATDYICMYIYLHKKTVFMGKNNFSDSNQLFNLDVSSAVYNDRRLIFVCKYYLFEVYSWMLSSLFLYRRQFVCANQQERWFYNGHGLDHVSSGHAFLCCHSGLYW